MATIPVILCLCFGYVVTTVIFNWRREQVMAEHLREREERLTGELREVRELLEQLDTSNDAKT